MRLQWGEAALGERDIDSPALQGADPINGITDPKIFSLLDLRKNNVKDLVLWFDSSLSAAAAVLGIVARRDTPSANEANLDVATFLILPAGEKTAMTFNVEGNPFPFFGAKIAIPAGTTGRVRCEAIFRKWVDD